MIRPYQMPNRHSIRLPDYDYSQQGLYFTTICTQNREYLFGDITATTMILNEFGKTVDSVWQSLPNRFPIKLDAFQIMPNHVHMIINIVGAGYSRPQSESSRQQYPTLGQIIAFFKYQSTKSINELSGAKTAPLRTENIYPKIWQRNFYEHIVRNDIELFKIREYIQNNPQMWDQDRNNLHQLQND